MGKPKRSQEEWAYDLWNAYLTGDHSRVGKKVEIARSLFRRLPKDPRCKVCGAPFAGVGGTLVGLLGFHAGRSRFNPSLCDRCEKIVKAHQVGVELQLTMLFADIRGSTTLAESLDASAYHRIIDRFYNAAAEGFVATGAMIDKLVGDEVIGLYVPGIAGLDYVRRAVEAALALLRATGHGSADGPWVPVGVGIHTGRVYIGAVGTSDSMSDITVLGDPVNTTARLASMAGPGELLVSEETAKLCGLTSADWEERSLELKGKSKPVAVKAMSVKA